MKAVDLKVLSADLAQTLEALRVASGASGTDDVRFISDDELMVLFPDRAVALIGKPGHQQLVFLGADKTAPRYE